MLDYIEVHYFAVFIIVMSIVVIGTWIAWVSSIGRYRLASNKPGVMFVMSELIVKIIDDFRHLLALVLLAIFACALAYAMYLATTLKDLTIAIHLVMSSLGGLVGSIVGYYFGESAVKRALRSRDENQKEANSMIQETQNNPETILAPSTLK